MTLTILALGDLHLGRRSARLPGELAGDRRCSSVAAWGRAVELALDRRVDAVVLTGDVVDRENRYYEALGPLTAGISRLAAAGIEVLAVAGNHDFDVLPRLARVLGEPRFRVLGEGGTWQRAALEREGRTLAVLDGWSFAGESFAGDPLDSYHLGPAGEAPLLGLLHGDATAVGSRYAPLSPARLRSAPVTAWLLGHIHRPAPLPGPGIPVLYPGSLQALDPGEPGVHGAWLLTLEGRRVDRFELVPLSSVRYEMLDVSLEGAADQEAFDRRWREAVIEALERAGQEGGGVLEALILRLRFGGRTPLHGRLRPWLDGLADGQDPVGGAVALAIDQAGDDTRPPIDLPGLAQADDAAGELARLLAVLETGEIPEPLFTNGLAALRGVHFSTGYGGLAAGRVPDPEPDADAARQAFLRAGYRLLDALLAQKLAQKPSQKPDPSVR